MAESTAPEIDPEVQAVLIELGNSLGSAYAHAANAIIGLDLVPPEDVGCAIAYAELMLDAQDALFALREAAARVSQHLSDRCQAILDDARAKIERRTPLT